MYLNVISYALVALNTFIDLLGASDLIVSIGTLLVSANLLMVDVSERLRKKMTLALDVQATESVGRKNNVRLSGAILLQDGDLGGGLIALTKEEALPTLRSGRS